ncbi:MULTISPECIES: SPOR domain-containing protein [unclassified Flavobacterium]|uniref:SPOR domain-containing protein n=1 Tax=unclassified Flavobacterium TaxID=196869 RepID=UPI001291CFC7|nr:MULTISPECIES: SPOR domain-containing protein [unclassified Flavobacterium]MQP51717.1 SPOR domain-containing protein [Flavobacterium sp. LMO9]MQP61587.1 SPOR domain-containing protein [Flavobacterium sp. LMO6]
MKKISKHNLLYFFIVSSFLCIKSNGQDAKASVSVDPKIDQLLKEKRKLNNSLFLNEGYKIQIFYGNSEDSKKKLQEFNREFKDLDSTIVFNSPNYKVWVGNFKTRIEVERVMIDIKKKYPSALIIKPSN